MQHISFVLKIIHIFKRTMFNKSDVGARRSNDLKTIQSFRVLSRTRACIVRRLFLSFKLIAKLLKLPITFRGFFKSYGPHFIIWFSVWSTIFSLLTTMTNIGLTGSIGICDTIDWTFRRFTSSTADWKTERKRTMNIPTEVRYLRVWRVDLHCRVIVTCIRKR